MDKDNLFDNQELFELVIIFFALVTFTFDSRVILWDEIRIQSLKANFGATSEYPATYLHVIE